MDLGPFAGYIWTSYGIAAAVIAGLIGWLVHDGRRQAALLSDLEARGIKRRSAE